MKRALVFALLLAACGEDTPADDLAPPIDAVPDILDLSVPYEPRSQLGCSALIQCVNNCADQNCIDQCTMIATFTGKQLFNALLGCVTSTCTVCAADMGSSACASCYVQVQTGLSADDMNDGPCCETTNPSPGACTMTIVDANPPPCGQCVDQLIACKNDPSPPPCP